MNGSPLERYAAFLSRRSGRSVSQELSSLRATIESRGSRAIQDGLVSYLVNEEGRSSEDALIKAKLPDTSAHGSLGSRFLDLMPPEARNMANRKFR